jgi:hypothetical protein
MMYYLLKTSAQIEVNVATLDWAILTASDYFLMTDATCVHIHLSAGCALHFSMRAGNIHIVDVYRGIEIRIIILFHSKFENCKC